MVETEIAIERQPAARLRFVVNTRGAIQPRCQRFDLLVKRGFERRVLPSPSGVGVTALTPT
jgi:hypothetical protein